MNFGEAIRVILYVNDLKAGNLAGALGYDISYISKWMNQTKLPSSKSAVSVCKDIASFAASHSTMQSRSETIIRLGLPISVETEDLDIFARSLSDKLYSLFVGQKSSGNTQVENGNNAVMVAEPSPTSAEDTINEVIAAYRNSTSDTLEGFLIMPDDYLFSDHVLIANRICSLEESKRKMRLKQIVNIDAYEDDVDRFVRYIIRHLSLTGPIEIDYYCRPKEKGQQTVTPVLALNGCVLIHALINSITEDQQFSVITHDQSIISEFCKHTDLYFRSLSPIIQRVSGSALETNTISYTYSLSSRNQYIMSSMVPIHLPEEMLEFFMDKYLDDQSQRDFQRKMYAIARDSFNSVVTFKSTLINYMNTGKIRLFDKVVTLTREERKRHLTHVADEIEKGERIAVTVLNDHNPLLHAGDIDLNIYMNENAVFGVPGSPEQTTGVLYFTNRKLCRYLEIFFDDLCSFSEEYAKTGAASANYIRNGIRLI